MSTIMEKTTLKISSKMIFNILLILNLFGTVMTYQQHYHDMSDDDILRIWNKNRNFEKRRF